QLGDDVGSQGCGANHTISVVDLAAEHGAQGACSRGGRDQRRQRRTAAAVSAADVGFGIFEGDAKRDLVGGMKHETVSRNTAPYQAELVIHVYILRVEDVTRQRR